MEIVHFCSLGTLCHSSNLLKRNRFKKCSYPFDWIFSNCSTVLHCIKDDFKIFLDNNYYIDIDNITKLDGNKCGHKYYDSRMFNHKDPRQIDDYKYYERCVIRFRNLLRCEEQKLFVIMFTNIENDIDEKYYNDIVEFNNEFLKYTTNYTLLCIFQIKNKERHYYNFKYNNNIHFLELHILSSSDGVVFTNEHDNIFLDTIIKLHYKIK